MPAQRGPDSPASGVGVVRRRRGSSADVSVRAPEARSASASTVGPSTMRPEQVVLPGFQRHEPGQDPQDVQQLRRVFGQPVVGLDLVQLSRAAACRP